MTDKTPPRPRRLVPATTEAPLSENAPSTDEAEVDDDTEVYHRDDRRAHGHLLVVGGPHDGEKAELSAGTCVVGRAPGCNLFLPLSTGVSRQHCKIQYSANRFVVMDLDSRNGTFVNGEPFERTPLAAGDILEVGDTRIRFMGPANEHPSLGARPASTTLEPPRRPQVIMAPTATAEPAARVPSGPVVMPPISQAPMMAEGPPHNDNRSVIAFAILSTVVVIGAALLIWDVARQAGSKTPVSLIAPPPAPQPAPQPPPQMAVTAMQAAPPAVTASSLSSSLPEKKPRFAPATPSPPATPVAATTRPAAKLPPSPSAGGTTAVPAPASRPASTMSASRSVLTSAAAGKVMAVVVNVGDVVQKGQRIIEVTPQSHNLRRKLEALRIEAQAFADVDDDTARANLAAVRTEIASIERRVKPFFVTSGAPGVVQELLVQVGDDVVARQAVARVEPTPAPQAIAQDPPLTPPAPHASLPEPATVTQGEAEDPAKQRAVVDAGPPPTMATDAATAAATDAATDAAAEAPAPAAL